jgi:hypothetical protein
LKSVVCFFSLGIGGDCGGDFRFFLGGCVKKCFRSFVFISFTLSLVGCVTVHHDFERTDEKLFFKQMGQPRRGVNQYSEGEKPGLRYKEFGVLSSVRDEGVPENVARDYMMLWGSDYHCDGLIFKPSQGQKLEARCIAFTQHCVPHPVPLIEMLGHDCVRVEENE